MNFKEFDLQINRLTTRFGKKAFDSEFIQLVWNEIKEMDEHALFCAANEWIGSRKPQDPPLLADFREVRLNEQKNRFVGELRIATNNVIRRSPDEMRGHLKKIKELMKIEKRLTMKEITK